MNSSVQQEIQRQKIITFFKETYRRYGEGIFWLQHSNKVELHFLTVVATLIDEYYKTNFNFMIGLNRAKSGSPGLMFVKEATVQNILKNEDTKGTNIENVGKKSLEIFQTRDISKCGFIIDVSRGRIGNFPFDGKDNSPSNAPTVGDGD